MKHQVICNEYRTTRELENGIQYYLNLYGDDAKVVVKVAPLTNFLQNGDLIKSETNYLLTLLIFEKTKFGGDQRE